MTINSKTFQTFDPSRVPSPCFVVDRAALEKNLQCLADIQTRSGAKVLLALKAFSLYRLAPLIGQYLSGTCASGLHEARLGHEEFGGEVHTFSAAFSTQEIEEVLEISKHVIFNSLSQWQRFETQITQAKKARPELGFGLRVNPMHSEGTTAIYDPCAPCSRLGVPITQLSALLSEKAPLHISPQLSGHTPQQHGVNLDGISGLHFHTLCEQGFAPLDRTLQAIEDQLGDWLHTLEWVNFGGGHHITADDYDTEALIDRIRDFSRKYKVQVYLEPGEAIAINTGVLVSEVLDISHNGRDLAILDTSATCHMPDTIEMPYRAHIFNTGHDGEKAFSYRLGGQTCLAGDVIGDYSFDQPLMLGQRLIFDDMSHYTMVKTTTFNGINLPSIALWDSNSDQIEIVRCFGYEDFKHRLS